MVAKFIFSFLNNRFLKNNLIFANIVNIEIKFKLCTKLKVLVIIILVNKMYKQEVTYQFVKLCTKLKVLVIIILVNKMYKQEVTYQFVVAIRPDEPTSLSLRLCSTQSLHSGAIQKPLACWPRVVPQ